MTDPALIRESTRAPHPATPCMPRPLFCAETITTLFSFMVAAVLAFLFADMWVLTTPQVRVLRC